MGNTIPRATPRFHLVRPAYLLMLALLQVAVLVDVAPPLAAILARDVHAFGAGGASLIRAAGYALTLAGTAVVLAFPALAFARHARGGRIRFRGLPRSCIAIALTGALLYALAKIAPILAHLSPMSTDVAAAAAAPALATAGIAIMAAGALVAEILRRSIAPVRVPIAPWQCRPVRIEVIDPPELATRGV